MAEVVEAGEPVEPVEAASTAPRPAWADRLRAAATDPRTPLAALLALVAVWVVVMARLIILRHEHLATFDFDEGIFDQFFWQLGHLEQFNTVRGVTLAGHHASFAFLLLAPLARLGGGPNLWNVLHAVAVAGTAVPLFVLTRDRLGRPWMGLWVGVAWLAQPTAAWLVQEGFHPEGMALPFLVGTFLFGERWRAQRAASRAGAAAAVAAGADPVPDRSPLARAWRWWRGADDPAPTRAERRTRWALVACFALTITWKEDLALALLGMGVVWLIRRDARLGLKVVLVSALWFVVLGMWLVPHFAGGTVYSGIYGDLGRTPGEIVLNSVQEPDRLITRLQDNDAVGYTRELTQSWAFVPFLSPSTLLIGAPQWFTNIISSAGFTFDPRLHYTAIPLGALGISFVEAIRRAHRWRRGLGEVLLAAGVVAALLCGRWDGPTPLGEHYDRGAWPLEAPVDLDVRREALARVPDGAGVSADYLSVPHLTHREVVYSFPNPWVSWNYGVDPGDTGEPADVGWLVIGNTGALRPADRELLDRLRASGEFAVRYEEGRTLVMERVAPPGDGTAGLGGG